MKYDKADNYETTSRRKADVFTSVIRNPGQDSYSITNEIYFLPFLAWTAGGPEDILLQSTTIWAKSKRATYLGHLG